MTSALSLSEEDGRLLIGVHITDVGFFVPPGSPIDRAALQRGTTVYLPRLTLPMLPPALSQQTASLVAGQDRPVLSFFASLDERWPAAHRAYLPQRDPGGPAADLCRGRRPAGDGGRRPIYRRPPAAQHRGRATPCPTGGKRGGDYRGQRGQGPGQRQPDVCSTRDYGLGRGQRFTGPTSGRRMHDSGQRDRRPLLPAPRPAGPVHWSAAAR